MPFMQLVWIGQKLQKILNLLPISKCFPLSVLKISKEETLYNKTKVFFVENLVGMAYKNEWKRKGQDKNT
jgi:hypothetical protein